MRKHALLMSCAMGALALSSGGAYAAAAAASTTDTGAASTVSEVIVTAEKRAQNIETVPVAVTAFTSQQRNVMGISTVQDMTDFTPGLTYSSELDRPAMRGISRNNNVYTSDSAVAIYYDDFYSNSTFLVGRDDMLIDQVEILLGPQGTLYGRNAIGGLINTLSKRPTDVWSGEVREIAGNYGYNKIEGTISGPIIDNLTFRASFYDLNQTKGYFTNLVPGTPSEGDVRHDPYADLQFEYKTDKDDLWLDMNALTFNNDRGGPGGLLGIPDTGPYDTALITNWTLFFNPNFAYGGGAVPGSVVGMIGTNNPSLTNLRDFAHAYPTDINVRGAYTVLLHEVHHMDGVDMKYVGGWSQYRYNLFTQDFEVDNSPITSYQIPLSPTGLCALGYLGPCGPLTVNPDTRFQYETETKWFSHEITFSSTTNKPLQWIAGAYFYNETDNNPETWYNPYQPQLVHPIGIIPLETGAGFVPAIANPSQDYLYLNYQDSINSIAGYGQIDWKVTPTIKLTGGLRYTYDYKSAEEESRYILFSSDILSPYVFGSALPAIDVTPVVAGSGLNPNGSFVKGVTCPTTYPTDGPYAGDAIRCLGDHSDALTGTAGVEWTPDDSTLVYLRYNRGYKAFGFNAGLVDPAPEALPEYVNDVEAGVKKTVGHTLVINADAFYYNYINAQIPIGVATPVGALTEFINIPKSASDGFELQATWTPIDRLVFNLTYGFNHTEILSTCTSVGGVPTGACYEDASDPMAINPAARPVGNATGGVFVQAVNGDELPQAPENKVAFNTTYTFQFSPGDLILSGTFIWKDKSYTDIFTRSYYEAPSWDEVDLRATWSGDHDRYEIVLYVKNLFNTIGYDSPTGGFEILQPVGGGAPTWGNAWELTPPRLYGVELHFKF